MFWRFTPLLSQLDTILDKQDVKLSEVLNEDDVILECKSHNQKLIDLIIVPENLLTLINYVVCDPPEEVADEVKFRLANIAGELLSADVCEVNDALVESDDYLKLFYQFFLNEAPLNPLLASFVVKILNVLTQRKGERIVEFFQSKDDFVDRIIEHIGTSAIMDFLLKFLQFSDPPVKCQVLNWFVESRLVPRLIEQLDSDNEEKYFNACQCLTNLLHACRDQFSQSTSQSDMLQLHDSLESKETVSNVLERMLSGDIRDSKVVNGLLFIEALIEQRRYDSPLDSLVPPSQSELDRLESTTQTVIQTIVPKLSTFKSILENPPNMFYQSMPTTCGVLNPPLGNTRLQVIHLLQSLYILDRYELNVALHAQNFLAVIQNLLFQYHWNTFLHKSVECLFTSIIDSALNQSQLEDQQSQEQTSQETEESNQRYLLLKQFLQDNQFIEKLLDVWQENKQEQSLPGGRRRGYMGHLNAIANHLQEIVFRVDPSPSSPRISQLLNDLGDQSIEDWKTFFDEEVTPLNNKNKIELDSFSRSESSSEEEDADYKLPSSLSMHLQQNFLEYQSQPITCNFPDTFGYGEEEFTENIEKEFYKDRLSSLDFSVATPEDTRNATMFEQACNEEIRQFDDFDEESEIDMTELAADLEEEMEEEDTNESDLNLYPGLNSSHSTEDIDSLSLGDFLSSDFGDFNDIDLKNQHFTRISRSPNRRPGSGANRLVALTKLKTDKSREFIPKSELKTSRKLDTPKFNPSIICKPSPLAMVDRIDFVDEEDENENEEEEEDDDDFHSPYSIRNRKLKLDLEEMEDRNDSLTHTMMTPRLKPFEKMDIDAEEVLSPTENNNSDDSDLLDTPPDSLVLNEKLDFLLSGAPAEEDVPAESPTQCNNNSTSHLQSNQLQTSSSTSTSPSPSTATAISSMSETISPPAEIVQETESSNHKSEMKEKLSPRKDNQTPPQPSATTTASPKRSNIIIVRMNGTEYCKPLKTPFPNTDNKKTESVVTAAPEEDDNADKWDHIAEEARQLNQQLDDISLDDIVLDDGGEKMNNHESARPGTASIPVFSDKRERYKEQVEFNTSSSSNTNGPIPQEKLIKFPDNSKENSNSHFSKPVIAQNNSETVNSQSISQTNGSDET